MCGFLPLAGVRAHPHGGVENKTEPLPLARAMWPCGFGPNGLYRMVPHASGEKPNPSLSSEGGVGHLGGEASGLCVGMGCHGPFLSP